MKGFWEESIIIMEVCEFVRIVGMLSVRWVTVGFEDRQSNKTAPRHWDEKTNDHVSSHFGQNKQTFHV
jgi:hypothetical protein